MPPKAANIFGLLYNLCVATRGSEYSPYQDQTIFLSRFVDFFVLSFGTSFSELREPFLKPFGDRSETITRFWIFGSKKVFSYVDFSKSDFARVSFNSFTAPLHSTVAPSTDIPGVQKYIFLESTLWELFKNIYFGGSTTTLEASKVGWKLTTLLEAARWLTRDRAPKYQIIVLFRCRTIENTFLVHKTTIWFVLRHFLVNGQAFHGFGVENLILPYQIVLSK